MYLQWFSDYFAHSTPTEWMKCIPRSNQLDPFAIGVMNLYWKVKDRIPLPELIFLASPEASNFTDFDFLKSQYQSPSKFVHSLPNIRILPFAQLTQWQGPVLCLQNDPHTIVSAITEALDWIHHERIWVIACFPSDQPPHLFESHLWVITRSQPRVGRFGKLEIVSNAQTVNDQSWILDWKKLSSHTTGQIQLPLAGNYAIRIFSDPTQDL